MKQVVTPQKQAAGRFHNVLQQGVILITHVMFHQNLALDKQGSKKWVF